MSSVHAQEQLNPRLSAEYRRCLQSNGASSVGIRQCQGGELQRQDRALNDAYRGLLAKVDAPHKKLLQASERAWLSYRESQCEYQALQDKGAMDWPITLDDRILDLTASRLDELRQMLDRSKYQD